MSGRLTIDRRRTLLDRLVAEETPEAEIRRLRAEYVDGLPRPEVSRCPFSGAVISRSIDTFGIDGPWWDVDDLLRAIEPYPDTVWAFSGAMRLADTIEDADFLVKPGPAVPFVVEHLIRHPAVKAVVSSVPVGPHAGFAIVYFADEGPEHLARVNDWGAPNYWYEDARGWWTDSVKEADQEVLFDLAPWIADGKLQWIAPGDASMKLRNEVAQCPYVGLEGTTEMQRVQGGRVWVPSGLVAPTDPAPTTRRSRRTRKR